MKQILNDDQPTGDPFTSVIPFVVFLDIYTADWFVEYAIDKEDPTDRNWKRWHDQPIQEHGELSRIIVYGVNNVVYRMNSGTTGATAFQEEIRILTL